MEKRKFDRLVSRRLLLQPGELERFIKEAKQSGAPVEDVLLMNGVPRHELLLCLSAYYGCPFIEYDESVVISQRIVRQMDMERLKQALWLPLSIGEDGADVIAARPADPAVLQDIKDTLGVEKIHFRIALRADLIRIIEHNQDLNPKFPPVAGRTPLAKVRTFLAERRSAYACHRTTLARARTGLAFLRTGLSFITIALALYRLFGLGLFSVFEAALLVGGIACAADGLLWYIPARRLGKRSLDCSITEPTGGTTVLAAGHRDNFPFFSRTREIAEAADLRRRWNRLSPVMRRRFLAGDRTDLAEERTVLACYRTKMASARTGLSFTRTGAAFAGLGIGLLRLLPAGPWTAVDAVMIIMGAAMVAEGFYWYWPGRRAGKKGAEAIRTAEGKQGIWESVFPFMFPMKKFAAIRMPLPPVKGYRSPGIWGTTGLALERTLLADRRNVMARLRTVMARSRTGMAFIRTGISIAATGLGLLVYFGTAGIGWTVLEAGMIAAGLTFIADGLSWYLPAEKTRRQYPYCFGEMEIADADYGMPAREWRKAVFSHDDV